MNKNMVILIVGIVAITLLLAGVTDEDYPSRFYIILKIAVCTAAILQAMKSLKCINLILWGNCFVAILFNPFWIINIERNIWVPIDIGVAVFFCAALYHSVNISDSKDHSAEQFFTLNRNMVILIVSIVAITLLLAGVTDEDYPSRFYTILKIAVCVAAVLHAVRSFERKNWIFWGNCFVAILFNPFFEISLERYAVRVFIDIGVAVFFITAMYSSFKQYNSKDHFADQFFAFIKSNWQFILIVCLIVLIILKLDSIQSDVSYIKYNVSSIQSDVSSIQSDVSSIKSDVSSIESDVSSIKSDVESIRRK